MECFECNRSPCRDRRYRCLQPAKLDDVQTHEVDTRFGRPSGPVRVGTLLGHRVAFPARHGEGHSLPPHKINYRANLAALQQLARSACWR